MPHSCYKEKKYILGHILGAAKITEIPIYKGRSRMDH